uniref:Cardiolipin synthase A n=1 Tax=Candidatus Aschnera chinzeii TaxID=1485666 RepID=A0AAT9G3X6_9ENTR|nr:MAG: cardiolipin synthase [Candidatus Aschnera chinzeii]
MLTINTLFNLIYISLYWIIITIVTIRVLLKQQPVTETMTWLLIIYIIPIIGIISYLIFTELQLGKRRIAKANNIWPLVTIYSKKMKLSTNIHSISNSKVATPLFKLCKNRQGIDGIKVNKLELFTCYINAINNLIHDINLASYNIEMVFYTWQMGGLVNKVTEALIIAAKRGIKCRIMIDSAGSWSFFHSKEPKKMRDAGIELIESLKVNIFRFFLRRMDLRQHRKIIIIDNYISYVGSMNMVDPRFYKQNTNIGPWIDIIIRMEGAISNRLSIIYAFDWELETEEHILSIIPTYKKDITNFNQLNKNLTQIIASGPGFPKNLMQQSLITAIYSANKQLILTTPYFVPTDNLINAICTAAMRGVEVYIIIPKKNNSFLVSWASKAFYTELLEAGVKIYHFHNGLLHVKSITVDNELSLIGSVNLDTRSLCLNFEIAIVIDDKIFGNTLSLLQQSYISNSTLISLKEWNIRPIWNKIIERICYFFSPLL